MSSAENAAPIVVGVDGSPDSLHAVDWAAGQAEYHTCPLRLVHAYRRPVAALPAVAVPVGAPAKESERMLVQAREQVVASHPDVAVSTVQREGTAPHVLLEESKDARLLVVGREGLGRIAELVLGSVSLETAMHARVPVAVVPYAWQPPVQPYGRIVLGVDGSKNCEAAIEYAFDAALTQGAELLAVYALDELPALTDAWPTQRDSARVDAELNRVLTESLARWRERYPDVVVATEGEVLQPAVALERHAARADLVVIGGRGHGAVTGALLGSAARSILRHIDRPVVIVHAGATATGEAS